MTTYAELLKKENLIKQGLISRVAEELNEVSQNFTLDFTPIGVSAFLYENKNTAFTLAVQAGWDIRIQEQTDKTGLRYELHYKPLKKENIR